MTLPRLGTILLALILIISSFLFQRAALKPAQEFLGFKVLTWEVASGCESGLIDAPPFKSLSAATASPGAQCTTSTVAHPGNRLEIEYLADAGRKRREKLEIVIESEDGRVLARFVPRVDGKWHVRPFDVTGNVRIAIRNDGEKDDLIRIRNRLNIYRSNLGEVAARQSLLSDAVLPLVLTVFAGAIVMVFLCLGNIPPFAELLVLFALAAAVHYRPYLSFAFDEWHMLDRIAREGVSAIWIAHNEHFIPAATALYLVEYRLFGGDYDGYLLVSLFLHALSAMALRRLFLRVLPDSPHAAAVLSGFFLIAGLHAEALQWCMCQGTVLATLAVILALCAAWDFVQIGGYSALVRVAGWSALALFSFAGSFVLIVQLAAIGLFAAVRFRAVPRLVPLGVLSAVVFLVSYLLYATARDAGGLSFNDPEIASAEKMGRYIILGTQFGTVLRGLGLYLSIEDRGVPGPLLGMIVSVALLLYYSLRRERLWFWAIGELSLSLPFIITAVARAQFGVDYAARSLRYQTPALIGLMILIAPLVSDLIAVLEKHRLRTARAAAGGVLIWYCFAQLHFVLRFDTFRDIGALGRKHLQQLSDWRALSANDVPQPSFELPVASPGNYPIYYRGNGERAEGVLTPLHPSEIIAIVSVE